MKRIAFIFVFFLIGIFSISDGSNESAAQKQADEFLTIYNSFYQRMYTVDGEANWLASTDVTDTHTGQRIGADIAYAAFLGSPYILEQSKKLLEKKQELSPITVRQLEKILYNAAHAPGTVPEIVNTRIAAEARQSATLDAFEFCAEREGNRCAKAVTPNQIDDALQKSADLQERKKMWEISKQSGVTLKPGLIELQKLRNQVAKAGGHNSYFALEVSDYGMTVPEMMSLLQKIITDTKPLYQQLHAWTKHTLAARYKQTVPAKIPAHWLGNRWSQEWPGIVEGIDLDDLFGSKSPEWLVQQAERF
ncbi:MAG TPA: M2 family metallopeptidase, partial [Acidobacteriota bacterium]|nr:M2 family metallopeptidase [Acidobacteriota bacterium]